MVGPTALRLANSAGVITLAPAREAGAVGAGGMRLSVMDGGHDFRILRGPAGARLRAVATLGDQSHRTAKAIAWVTANYAKPLLVEELAQVASMGVSTLHHHFRMLTSMSPLQYQKHLRLQSARSLMLNNGLDAASAAFEVGYESPTQFNREYSRFFGQPPMRDIRTLLSPAAPKLELVGSL